MAVLWGINKESLYVSVLVFVINVILIMPSKIGIILVAFAIHLILVVGTAKVVVVSSRSCCARLKALNGFWIILYRGSFV